MPRRPWTALGRHRSRQRRDVEGVQRRCEPGQVRPAPEQSWALLQNRRIRIDRADVPEGFEEWDVFVVQTPFEFSA